MKMRRRVEKAKRFFYLAAGGIGRQGCFFIAFAIIARRIQVREFGMLSYWYAIVIVLAGCADWGMRFWGWRQVAQEPDNWRIINGILIIKTVVGSVIFGAYISTVIFVLNSQDEMSLAVALGGCIVLNQLTIDWLYRGLNKHATVGLIGLVSGVTFLAGVELNPWPTKLMMYGIALVVSNTIGNLYPILAIRNAGWSWQSVEKKEMILPFREGSNYVILSVLNRFYPAYPLILVRALASLHEIGVFRIGQMSYTFMVSISYYVVGAIYTELAQGKLIRKDPLLMLRKASIICILIIGSIIGVIMPFIDEMTLGLLGVDYIKSAELTRWFLWLVPLGFLHMLWRECIPAFVTDTFRARSIIFPTVVGSALCIAGYVCLGLYGVILGIAAGEIVGMSYCAIFLFRIRDQL